MTGTSIFRPSLEPRSTDMLANSDEGTMSSSMAVAESILKLFFFVLKARSDGLRKMQWDREFSNSLHFLHAKKLDPSA